MGAIDVVVAAPTVFAELFDLFLGRHRSARQRDHAGLT